MQAHPSWRPEPGGTWFRERLLAPPTDGRQPHRRFPGVGSSEFRPNPPTRQAPTRWSQCSFPIKPHGDREVGPRAARRWVRSSLPNGTSVADSKLDGSIVNALGILAAIYGCTVLYRLIITAAQVLGPREPRRDLACAVMLDRFLDIALELQTPADNSLGVEEQQEPPHPEPSARATTKNTKPTTTRRSTTRAPAYAPISPALNDDGSCASWKNSWVVR